jgi:hypothetical protein
VTVDLLGGPLEQEGTEATEWQLSVASIDSAISTNGATFTCPSFLGAWISLTCCSFCVGCLQFRECRDAYRISLSQLLETASNSGRECGEEGEVSTMWWHRRRAIGVDCRWRRLAIQSKRPAIAVASHGNERRGRLGAEKATRFPI